MILIWTSKTSFVLQKIQKWMRFSQGTACYQKTFILPAGVKRKELSSSDRHIDMFGDKVKAREQALVAGIPVIPGTDGPVNSLEEVMEFSETAGFPLMIKASLGGGGRGMRIVKNAEELPSVYERAKSEAKAAFGSDEMYVEKFVYKPKHIEVQILGDLEGNVIHLYERDYFIQRRHQEVVEFAPSNSISNELRNAICDAAIKLMKI